METVLITGSTSSIGEELAIFLSKKYRIILSGRDSAKLTNLKSKLCGENHLMWVCDLINDKISESLFEFLNKFQITPTHFLHVGGDFSVSPIRLQKKEKTFQSFQVNVFSAIEIASVLSKKEFKKQLKNIIFFSSISALRGKPGYAVYSAAKSSLFGLTKSLAIELSPIKVNCFVLGAIMTKTTEDLLKDKEETLNSHIPLGLGNPNAVNDWITVLLEKNNWMTGQKLIIDGGSTAL
jgi:NAD(P)-dependent dehydrogenase (short-subunit alcohol dehydrogenase family)